MKILVITDSKKIPSFFEILNENCVLLEFIGSKNWIKNVVSISPDIVYLDISGMDKETLNTNIRLLDKMEDFQYAIIDPQGFVDDPMAYIHYGACDYIGSSLLRQKYSLKRLKKLLYYLDMEIEEDTGDHNYSLDWYNVVPGQGYEFVMLYLAIDDSEKWKTRMGISSYTKMIQQFSSTMLNLFKKINGREWIWTEENGIILFPFDGKNCEALMTCFRINLNKILLSIEKFKSMDFTFRMVLHIGSCAYYEKGQTGEIISDTVNTLFHLGQKYTVDNSFTVTESIKRFIPESFLDLFVNKGEFEGQILFQMKNPR